MARTGMKPKLKSLKQQRLDAELGLIIDEFGRAMFNADKAYIAERNTFTPNMHFAWLKYLNFCLSNS
jgi:hypothetical protein